jgi:signal transduction histidine kinase
MKNSLLIILLLIGFSGYGQQKIIDSISLLLKTPISDSIKVKVYGDLSWYYGNISIDSAFHYGELALNLSKKTKNLIGVAQAYNDIGILHYKISNFNKSIAYYKNALALRVILKDTLGIGSLYNKMGIAYQRIFKMDSALYYNTKALEIYENANHTNYIALIKNNIANIYFNLKQYKKALDEHLEVAKIRADINDNFGLTYSFTNIGNAYLYLNDTIQSLNYYKKGIDIAEQNNYSQELATLYNNYGTILKNQGNYKDAISYFTKSLNLRESLNDNYGVSSVLLNIGDLYMSTGQINEAEEKLRRGLNLAKISNAKEKEMNAYKSLVTFFAYKKNTDSILHYQKLFTITQDDIFNTRITKEIAEIQEKYDTVQREKEIAKQKEQLLKKELEIKNKNLITLLFGFGLLLLAIVSFGLHKRQQHKKREYQNQLKLKEAQTFSKLLDQRLSISRDLHDNIGSQLTLIISSIDNLKFLTKNSDAVFQSKLTEINNFAGNAISELRDTIWAMNKNKISYEDFQGRILSFIEKAKLASSNCHFNFNSTVKSPIYLSSAKGINLFRIIQEAINNALKYAKASEISISIIETEKNLIIKINDNGIGFDLNTAELGNGLGNMQKRASEINGKINIQSKINTGTQIEIVCDKNKTNAL